MSVNIVRLACRFGVFWCVAFAGIVCIGAIELIVLWLAGHEHTPKSVEWQTSIGSFSVSDGGERSLFRAVIAQQSSSGSVRRELRLWEAKDNVTRTIDLGELDPSCCSIAPSGESIVFSTEQGAVYHLDVRGDGQSMKREWLIAAQFLHRFTGERISNIVISPNDQFLAVVTNASVYVCDQVTKKMMYRLPQPNTGGLPLLTFSVDSQLLVTSTGDQHVAVWRTSDGSSVASRSFETGAVVALQVTADNRQVAVLVTDSSLRLWSLRDGKVTLRQRMHSFDFHGQPLAFSPDGRLLATSNRAFVQVHDTLSGEVVCRLDRHTACICGLGFATSTLLYSCDVDATLHRTTIKL